MVDTIVRNDTDIDSALTDFQNSVNTAVGEENAQ